MTAKAPETGAEATASATARVTWRGYDVLVTMRGESGLDALQRMDAALTWLEDRGAAPAGQTAKPAQPSRRAAPAPADGPAPSCPECGGTMRPSRWGGWFCPTRLPSGDYCTGKLAA